MLEENSSMDTVIQIMTDSLEKKYALLQTVEEKTKEQENLLKGDDFTLKQWDELTEEKSAFINQIIPLDAGFETVYAKIKTGLAEQKNNRTDEIREIQSLIQKIMDKSAVIEAMEDRNRFVIEHRLQRDKKEIHRSKSAVAAANSYRNYAKNLKNIPQSVDFKS